MEQIVLLIAAWWWAIKFIGEQANAIQYRNPAQRAIVFAIGIIGYEIPLALIYLLAKS